MKTWKDMEEAMIGKTIVAIEPNNLTDEGFVLVMNDGTRLSVGWSGNEGGGELNGTTINF